MVKLVAPCLAQYVDMRESGESELACIRMMVEKIRAKQAAKRWIDELSKFGKEI